MVDIEVEADIVVNDELLFRSQKTGKGFFSEKNDGSISYFDFFLFDCREDFL